MDGGELLAIRKACIADDHRLHPEEELLSLEETILRMEQKPKNGDMAHKTKLKSLAAWFLRVQKWGRWSARLEFNENKRKGWRDRKQKDPPKTREGVKFRSVDFYDEVEFLLI